MEQNDSFSRLKEYLLEEGLSEFAFGGEQLLDQIRNRIQDHPYDIDRAGGILILALPYDLWRWDTPAGEGELEIAAFAANNYYESIKRILRQAAGMAGFSWYRLFVNSRLPEKYLAAKMGLGFIGRSSLLVNRKYGPSVLLGGLVLSSGPPPELDSSLAIRPEGKDALMAGRLCASCRACIDACPAAAISLQEGYKKERCIQYWASREGQPPAEIAGVWGKRFYGCDECLKACPLSARTKGIKDHSIEAERIPGPRLEAASILDASEEKIKNMLKGSALGMKHFPPSMWQKNARIAGVAKGCG